MIQIPSSNTKQWKKSNASDLYGNVFHTKNIDFNEEGYLKLAGSTRSTMDETVDADFDRCAVIIFASDFNYFIETWDEPFSIESELLAETASQITAADNPTAGGPQSDAVWFDNKLAVTETNDLHYYDDSSNTWVDTNIALSSTNTGQHPVENFVSFSSLAVANLNTIGLYSALSATPTLTRTLTIPADFYVTSMKYFNQNLYIGTKHINGQKAYLFVWNGEGTAAQSAFKADSNIIHDICVFQDSIVALTSNGSLLKFNGTGFTMIDAFPIFYTNRTLVGATNINMYHNVLIPNGDILYISFSDSDNSHAQMLSQPAGVWCYDPKVGLYHRYCFSSARTIKEAVSTSDVDTTTEQILVAAAPPTGTEAYYKANGGTAIGGLTDNTKYFTIKVDATHVKLATTKANALAGTAIDLTGTGQIGQELIFFPNIDFGQYFASRPSAIQTIDYTPERPQYGSDVIWSGDVPIRTDATSNTHTMGSISTGVESRGYFITPKVFSDDVTDSYNTFSLKFAPLTSELDKIIVKYRTTDDGLNEINLSTTVKWDITWTSSTTFTTTDTHWAGAAVGDEVEVLRGAGAGYISHISSISLNTGTYTVTIDDSYDNYTAGDVGTAIFRNWTKLATITNTDTLGYLKLELGNKINGKFIQFKIELRGIAVKIEQLLINNVSYLPANK